MLNLKDFGAIGNNSDDDSSAVQAWLQAAHDYAVPGYAPSGRYKLNTQVSITLANDNPLRIYGNLGGSGVAPFGTQFRLGQALTNNNTPMILIDGNNQSSFVEIQNIRCAGGGLTGTAFRVKNVNHRTIIRGCRFDNFLGRGLWLYAPIGFLVESVLCDQNATGLDLDGVTSIGEGAVIASKFASNTTAQIDFNSGTSFVHVAGTTIYGSGNQAGVRFLANDVFSVGFYQCSFESATPGLVAGSGITINDLTVENCVFNPSAASGTKYAIDLDDVRQARIQNNSFDCVPSSGATIVGVRIASSASARNQLGPNRFVNSGAGTLTNYSVPTNVPIAHAFDASGAHFAPIKYNQTAQATQFGSATFPLANNSVHNLTDGPEGFVIVTASQDDAAALLHLRGPGGAVAIVSDPTGFFSATAGTASKVNVYWSATNSRYELENKRGAARDISVIVLGSGF